ncbi:MAG TPA: SDR family oxidoreductase [Candidatus Tenderia electrophaga]|uniref:SDR family oxidoreductase n=1 Tax=Candidatus Tenderia electrophaga TaxID=1748243 RepID=A0A832J2X9_9GAMM|nr:SDR family oxidoreductase [Candidatus Tenderia electrophaga]
MRLLLTGATGFLGAAITKRLVSDANYRLVLAVRRVLPGHVPNVSSVLVDDLSAATDWTSALAGIDVVIHASARVHVMNDTATDPREAFHKVNFEGTMALARQAVRAGVRRFIFISSIKVNGEETMPGKPFTADDLPKPVDPYGVSKAETEQALRALATETGIEVVIVRPVLVYGPGVKANFNSMMKWLSKEVPLPLGSVHNKRSLVALDNIVDLIVACVEHPAAANQVFLVSDGEDLSTTELLQRVGNALGVRTRLLPVPAMLIKFAASLLGKRAMSQRLLGSMQVDISKTRELLDWVPPVSVDAALEKTAQSFLSQK